MTEETPKFEQAKRAVWIEPETHLRLRQSSLVLRRHTKDIADEAIRDWLDRNCPSLVVTESNGR